MYNVSFGSSYKFDADSKITNKVLNRIHNYEFKGGTVITTFKSLEESRRTGIYENINLWVPDYMDDGVEKLLISKGIDFHKTTKDEAYDPDNIKNRIEVSPNDEQLGYFLVEFDTEKLDKLFKEDGVSYIEPYGKNGIFSRYSDFGEYLKTGEKIYATKVKISETDGEPRASVIDGRHRFAFMRDLGLKKIPVAVNKESYDLAKKYCLI